jgi:hypothetical protein
MPLEVIVMYRIDACVRGYNHFDNILEAMVPQANSVKVVPFVGEIVSGGGTLG